MFIPRSAEGRATMPDPSSLRDATQIVLSCEELEGVRGDLESRFTVTIVPGTPCRIVGSPIEIKKAGEFLARSGVPVR